MTNQTDDQPQRIVEAQASLKPAVRHQPSWSERSLTVHVDDAARDRDEPVDPERDQE